MSNYIDNINKNIGVRVNDLCKINDGQIFGAVTPVMIRSEYEEDQRVYPAVIDNSGEGKYVFSDDDYAFGVYHRILNRNYSQIDGFGDTNKDVVIDDVMLICWGFRNQLNMDAFQFEREVIVPSLPGEILLNHTNFDQINVFNGEFKNLVYNLVPGQFLFSLKYKVRYIFNRECLEINEKNKC